MSTFPSRLPGLFLFYYIEQQVDAALRHEVSIPPTGIVPFLLKKLALVMAMVLVLFPSRLPGLFLFYCNS